MKLKEITQSILADASSDNSSSIRFAMLEWSTGVLLVWGAVSLYHGKLVEIPESVVVLLGGLIGGKVWQRLFGESRACTPIQQPSTGDIKPKTS